MKHIKLQTGPVYILDIICDIYFIDSVWFWLYPKLQIYLLSANAKDGVPIHGCPVTGNTFKQQKIKRSKRRLVYVQTETKENQCNKLRNNAY